jgi:photosystem II stability/assembly factor-like uncharacterized protein
VGAPPTDLGNLTAGGAARTATGAGVCRVTFGSSNDSAQLRISQADGAGDAMALGLQPPAIQQRQSAPGRMMSVFGYDNSLAMIVGRSATLLRTTNGGMGWTEFSVGGVDLFDVEATPANADRWWAVGKDRTIYRTVDAQVATPTWTSQAAALASAGWPAGMDIDAITIPDANTIYIAGEDGWIASSPDAGVNWTAFQHADASVGRITGIDAFSATSIIAVSDGGRVLRNATGGKSSAAWAVSVAPNVNQLNDVAMGAANRAYAVGSYGYFASWDGTTWTDRTAVLDTHLNFLGVSARPGAADTAFITDEAGGVWRTPDQGGSWTYNGVVATELRDVHAATNNYVYLAGSERSAGYSNDAAVSWTTWPTMTSFGLAAVAASPVNGKVAVAVGTRGHVRRTTDGGATWTGSTIGGPSLLGVSLANSSVGWAVGDNATIRYTGDAGATWTAQSAPAGVTERLLSVVAIDQYRAVAVGRGGTILRTTNGGSTWTSISSGTTRALNGVSAGGDTVVVVGAHSTIMRSTDAGATWSTIVPGTLPDPALHLTAVDMSSDLVGYATLDWDDVWRTADGGATWTQVAGGTAGRNRSIAATGNTFVVAGRDDVTSRSTDAGATVTAVSGTTGMQLTGAAAIDTHSAYVVGADTLLMRLDADTSSPQKQVGDWLLGTRDWSTAGFFGVCLQAVGGGAVGDWTVDTANVAGTCEGLDTDPWQAVPAAASKAAHTTAAGNGSVDLVWGMRAKSNQTAGRYEATVAFEALAPNF